MNLLTLENVTTYVGQNEQMRPALNKVDLAVSPGDFITVIGTNGAGKSTLFNVISGDLPIHEGELLLKEKNVKNLSSEKRAKYISRVFQDPKLGTAPRMTVLENLSLAENRGQKFRLKIRHKKQKISYYQELCATFGNHLENHLDTPTENLSGGQRQALSLLMATLKTPDLLLLDEHTAALDPKTSFHLMNYTEKIIHEKKITCLMITHHLKDALKYGNRLIALDAGKIVMDVRGDEKKLLVEKDLQMIY